MIFIDDDVKSMRLIDADKLMNAMDKAFDDAVMAARKVSDQQSIIVLTILAAVKVRLIAEIKKQPTAYNINMVLHELKKCRMEEQDVWNGLDDECAFGSMNAYGHAIEIVKGGLK